MKLCVSLLQTAARLNFVGLPGDSKKRRSEELEEEEASRVVRAEANSEISKSYDGNYREDGDCDERDVQDGGDERREAVQDGRDS